MGAGPENFGPAPTPGRCRCQYRPEARTEELVVEGWHRGCRAAGTGEVRGRRRLPRADRSVPARAPGALLSHARIASRRRGRPAGDTAVRLEGDRQVRAACVATDVAVSDRNE